MVSSKFIYNEEALENLHIEDPSILDRLIDREAAREAHLNKRHDKFDKRTTLKNAVEKYVQDGDVVADTGFGYVRTPEQVHFEIMRQGKKDLHYIGSPNTNHSFVAFNGNCRYSHTSYVGAEMRGTDRLMHKMVRDGRIQIMSDWSHGSMGMGFKAAQFGAPYITCKQMLGSDMLKYNPYLKVMDDPYSKDKNPVCVVPALHPDVTFIHCQQADIYGNAKIIGPTVNDVALAFASKKVVITCEEIIPHTEMRFNTKDNVIPFYLVDAVVELPFGCLPGMCPGYYYWSREWWEWMLRIATKTYENVRTFVDYWMLDSDGPFDTVNKLNKHLGGAGYIHNLRRLQRAEEYLLEDEGVDYEYTQVIPIWDNKEEG